MGYKHLTEGDHWAFGYIQSYIKDLEKEMNSSDEKYKELKWKTIAFKTALGWYCELEAIGELDEKLNNG